MINLIIALKILSFVLLVLGSYLAFAVALGHFLHFSDDEDFVTEKTKVRYAHITNEPPIARGFDEKSSKYRGFCE